VAGLTRMLDTDVMIELVRGRDLDIDRRVGSSGAVCVSAVTVAELRFGARRARRPEVERAIVESTLSRVQVEDLGREAAECAGDVRAALAQAGTMIGAHDVLIAGHALALGLTLVTRNVREFERVEGLVVERW
jgi:tRNA(fMet)-specific endonuclease VapC